MSGSVDAALPLPLPHAPGPAPHDAPPCPAAAATASQPSSSVEVSDAHRKQWTGMCALALRGSCRSLLNTKVFDISDLIVFVDDNAADGEPDIISAHVPVAKFYATFKLAPCESLMIALSKLHCVAPCLHQYLFSMNTLTLCTTDLAMPLSLCLRCTIGKSIGLFLVAYSVVVPWPANARSCSTFVTSSLRSHDP